MIPFNPFSVYAGTAGWVHPEPPRPRRSSRQSARDCAVEHQAHLQAPALVWTFGRVHLDQIASLARQKGSGSGKLTRSNFMHHRSLLKNQITWFFIIFPSLWSSSCPLFQFVQVGGCFAGALGRGSDSASGETRRCRDARQALGCRTLLAPKRKTRLGEVGGAVPSSGSLSLPSATAGKRAVGRSWWGPPAPSPTFSEVVVTAGPPG